MKRLLVIDDELGTRESLKEIFFNIAEVLTAANALEALGILSKATVDLIILDLIMPGLDGIAFLKEAREIYPNVPVVVISASPAEKRSKEALDLGAVAYVSKPFDLHEVRQLVDYCLHPARRPEKEESFQNGASDKSPLPDIIGESQSLRKAIAEARTASATELPVLLVGESGTGKELLSRQIHSWSGRAHESFVPVRCGKIPQSFLEVELYGTESLGNPLSEQQGAFDLAGDGTIFLGQIDRLSESAQMSLANLIKTHGFSRVGSRRVIPTRARILATLLNSPTAMVQAGAFDGGLATCFLHTIVVPPLRERPQDIPLLAYHFLNHLRSATGAATLIFEPEAMEKLCRYPWPGNVRELRSVVERIMIRYGKERCVRAAGLPLEFGGDVQIQPIPETEEAPLSVANSGRPARRDTG